MTWRADGSGWRAVAVDAAGMRALGGQLAAHLRAGDVVVLDGPLGAGKTTLTQGIGRALAVRGAVTSPTFVIARRHPGPGPALVHVDAYRLASGGEVDDLDLDEDLDSAVTVIEWGAGKVERLAPSRLEVRIDRVIGARGAGGSEPGDVGGDPEGPADPDDPAEDPAGGARVVRVHGIGPRWSGLVLAGG